MCISRYKKGGDVTGRSNSNKNCKSIFKNGYEAITKAEFTKIWADMINRIEKNKSVGR